MLDSQGQAGTHRDLDEGSFKLSDDLRDSIREMHERGNAFLAPKRAVTREDYLAGEAYLRWGGKLVASGRGYELLFVAKAIVGAGDIDVWPVVPTASGQPNKHEAGDGHNKAVFIYKVEIMDCTQGLVPSWVRLQVTHDLHDDGASFPNILFEPFFKVVRSPYEGEVGVVNRLSARGSDGRDEIVERRSQIMDRIADDKRQFSGDGAVLLDVETETLSLEVQLLPDSVWIATKELGDFRFKVSDMAICPLDL